MGGTNNTQIMSSASLTTVGGSWNPILPGWGAGQIGATPVITVSATDANAAETVSGNLPNPGVFTFTRTGSTVASLTVNFGVGGTAISGTDYTALPTSVTFAPDSSTATVTISPIDDQIDEGDETVFFVLLDNAAYAVGPADSATVTITDNKSLLTPGEPDNYQPAPINPVALSQDPQINALLSGYKWTKTALTYSFSNLSITTINNIRNILESWVEPLINLSFAETAGIGDIHYKGDSSPRYAWAYYPGDGIGGDVYLNPSYDNNSDSNGFQGGPGTHGFMSIIHETLHVFRT